MSAPHPFDLTGKRAIITGSSKGIGRAIAITMADLGAKVVISSRKREACEPVAEEIRARGGEAIVLPCNISRREEVTALIAGTVEAFGGIDILVCNAAVNPYYGPLAEIDDGAFDKVMNSNVKSNLWLCRDAQPHLAENGGAVVIISSIAGLRASDNIGAYGISKAADFALARQLGAEWGPQNIRVNCIAPGLIKTDFARALWEDPQRRSLREETTPLRRIGDPEDISGVAAFLASPAAAFMTGTVVTVDGGVTIA